MTPKDKLAIIDAALQAKGTIERGGWVCERDAAAATLAVDGAIHADLFFDRLVERLVELGWRAPGEATA